MSWLSKLFGSAGNSNDTRDAGGLQKGMPPLFSDTHPAAKEVAEVEGIVAKTIEIQVAGSGTITSFNSEDYCRIKDVLDRAVAKAPTDPDLIYARASLHFLALQGEDGQKDREECLKFAPEHFDARTKKDHPQSWDSLFTLPGWDERKTQLSDLMMKHVEIDHLVQVVRDHLRGAVAVVVPESRVKLAGCSKMRWELRWVSTPQGNVAAHYLFLDNGQFQEFFIPHLAESEAKVNTNYWLLRRLAGETYCFITIHRGRSVVRSERFVFPPTLVQTLRKMGGDLLKSGPASSMSQFKGAAQWYMQNTAESTLKY